MNVQATSKTEMDTAIEHSEEKGDNNMLLCNKAGRSAIVSAHHDMMSRSSYQKLLSLSS